MVHELKIWPQYYARVADGTKTFEVRDNDRGFQFGDSVILREWDPEPQNPAAAKDQPKGYTGSQDMKFKVGFIFSLGGDRVVFSLLPIEPTEVSKKPKGK